MFVGLREGEESAEKECCLVRHPINIYAYSIQCFSRLSQGLEDDILESSIGRWADTVATYCPGRTSQIVLKFITKYRDRREKTLCSFMFPPTVQ